VLVVVVVLVAVGTQTTFGSPSLLREFDGAGRVESLFQGTMIAFWSFPVALVPTAADVVDVLCLWVVVLNVLVVVLVAEIVVDAVLVVVCVVLVAVVVVVVVVLVVVSVVLLVAVVAVVLVDVAVLVVAVVVLLVLVFVLVENMAAISAADGITTHTKPDTTSGFGERRGFSPFASLLSQHLSETHL